MPEITIKKKLYCPDVYFDTLDETECILREKTSVCTLHCSNCVYSKTNIAAVIQAAVDAS